MLMQCRCLPPLSWVTSSNLSGWVNPHSLHIRLFVHFTFRSEGGDVNSMWIKMSTCIRKVVLEEFRVIKGGKCETKDAWWNKKMQNAIK
jgi:hypothetical protein